MKRCICEDRDGELIKVGDTVIDNDGNEYLIEWGKHRELFGFGYVHGYYIPDNPKKLIK